MRKRVSLVLIALAVVLGTVGSKAFTSAETDCGGIGVSATVLGELEDQTVTVSCQP